MRSREEEMTNTVWCYIAFLLRLRCIAKFDGHLRASCPPDKRLEIRLNFLFLQKRFLALHVMLSKPNFCFGILRLKYVEIYSNCWYFVFVQRFCSWCQKRSCFSIYKRECSGALCIFGELTFHFCLLKKYSKTKFIFVRWGIGIVYLCCLFHCLNVLCKIFMLKDNKCTRI